MLDQNKVLIYNLARLGSWNDVLYLLTQHPALIQLTDYLPGYHNWTLFDHALAQQNDYVINILRAQYNLSQTHNSEPIIMLINTGYWDYVFHAFQQNYIQPRNVIFELARTYRWGDVFASLLHITDIAQIIDYFPGFESWTLYDHALLQRNINLIVALQNHGLSQTANGAPLKKLIAANQWICIFSMLRSNLIQVNKMFADGQTLLDYAIAHFSPNTGSMNPTLNHLKQLYHAKTALEIQGQVSPPLLSNFNRQKTFSTDFTPSDKDEIVKEEDKDLGVILGAIGSERKMSILTYK